MSYCLGYHKANNLRVHARMIGKSLVYNPQTLTLSIQHWNVEGTLYSRIDCWIDIEAAHLYLIDVGYPWSCVPRLYIVAVLIYSCVDVQTLNLYWRCVWTTSLSRLFDRSCPIFKKIAIETAYMSIAYVWWWYRKYNRYDCTPTAIANLSCWSLTSQFRWSTIQPCILATSWTATTFDWSNTSSHAIEILPYNSNGIDTKCIMP